MPSEFRGGARLFLPAPSRFGSSISSAGPCSPWGNYPSVLPPRSFTRNRNTVPRYSGDSLHTQLFQVGPDLFFTVAAPSSLQPFAASGFYNPRGSFLVRSECKCQHTCRVPQLRPHSSEFFPGAPDFLRRTWPWLRLDQVRHTQAPLLDTISPLTHRICINCPLYLGSIRNPRLFRRLGSRV